jgi:hypothetical protein
LATQLMRQAMDELAREGRIPILDATPDGRAVYRRLGFEDSWSFARLLRRQRQHTTELFVGPAADVVVRAIVDQDWPALCAYDAAAFGADRSAVLRGLRGRLPAAEFVAEHAGRVVGFALGRDGGLAAQVGPLIADDEAIAAALLERALEGIEGPLFVDLADSKQELRRFLDARGFASVRPFTRMLYGSSTRFDDAARTCAVIGPEFG